MRRKSFRFVATPFRKTAHTFPGIAPSARTIAEICLFIVVVVVVACTVNLHEERTVDRAASVSGHPGDALKAELMRCQSLGKTALDDPVCTAVWAENRQRFFADRKADPDRHSPDQPQVRR
jgi:conjugative transfer region protein TrbK